MGKIFGISSLPVAKAFPSLDYSRNYPPLPAVREVKQPTLIDTYISTSRRGKFSVKNALKYTKNIIKKPL